MVWWMIIPLLVASWTGLLVLWGIWLAWREHSTSRDAHWDDVDRGAPSGGHRYDKWLLSSALQDLDARLSKLEGKE